jgi:hypothetical protein
MAGDAGERLQLPQLLLSRYGEAAEARPLIDNNKLNEGLALTRAGVWMMVAWSYRNSGKHFTLEHVEQKVGAASGYAPAVLRMGMGMGIFLKSTIPEHFTVDRNRLSQVCGFKPDGSGLFSEEVS